MKHALSALALLGLGTALGACTAEPVDPPAAVPLRTITGNFGARRSADPSVARRNIFGDQTPTVTYSLPDGGTRSIRGSMPYSEEEARFSVARVPEGTYTLIEGGSLFSVVTDASELDLSAALTGPAGLPRSTQDVGLSFDVEGLEPWALNSELHVVVPRHMLLHSHAEMENGPVDGDTALRSASLALWYPLDASSGDSVTLLQLGRRDPSPEVITLAAVRAHSWGAVSAVPQETTQLQGTLTELPQQTPGEVEVRTAEFRSLTSSIHPRATLDAVQLRIEAQQGAGVAGLFERGATLMRAHLPTGQDQVVFTPSYGDPFQGQVDTVALLSSTYAVPLQVPGGDSYLMALRVQRSGPVDSLPQAPLRPELTPPRNLRVGGQSLLDGATGVGSSAVFQWDAPEAGAPDRYRAELWDIPRDAQTDPFHLGPVHQQVTRATEARFPEGVLQSGHFYVLIVTAERGMGEKALTHPNLHAIRSDLAPAISGVFSP